MSVRRYPRAVPEHLDRRIREARGFYDHGEHDQAEAKLWPLLAECEAELGERHPEVIALRNLLGSVLFQQRRTTEAAQLHQEAMRQGIRVLGRNDPDTLAYAHNYGTALLFGQAGEGIKVLEDTLRRRSRKLGGHHEDTLATANALGAALFATGSFGPAVDRLRWAYEASVRLGAGHPLRQDIEKNLRIALRNSGRR
ncbi:tetratricopeptide repeat protein [Nocardiopsis dassonvillei]|uniref:tetratricopeptide repeat protein n=1 Tax=Nocardiopsis dassonvillei TaxID=2014 RepID=UPI003F578C49